MVKLDISGWCQPKIRLLQSIYGELWQEMQIASRDKKFHDLLNFANFGPKNTSIVLKNCYFEESKGSKERARPSESIGTHK